MTILQDRIKSQRKKLNKTLATLAEEIGVKEATAQRYESGAIKNIKYNTIVLIANALKCSPVYLLGWTDDPTPSATPIEHGVKDTVVRVAFTESGNYEVVRFPDAILKKDNTILDMRSLTENEKDDIIKYIEFVLSKKGEK